MTALKQLIKNKFCRYYFLRQPHRMVKDTQTIRRQKPIVFDHFVGLVLKGLTSSKFELIH